MKKNTKNKSSNNKNNIGGYIKIALIFVVTIFAILLLRNWYLSGINYQLNTPIIGNVLVQEINTEEVYNYIRENENAILYVGVVNDRNCRKFEEEFQKRRLWLDKEVREHLVFMQMYFSFFNII